MLKTENPNKKYRDYKNFKQYVGATSFLSHMDYLRHDVAPDLIRFINAKLGKKNSSYYTFLKKIGEPVPPITDVGLITINQISELLPLVRFEEFQVLKSLVSQESIERNDLILECHNNFNLFREDHLDHALMHLESIGLIEVTTHEINRQFNLESPEFLNYISDLLEYGLERYKREFGGFKEDFKIYSTYTKKQVSMMSMQDKIYTYIKGTKIEKDGTVYIYVNLKKADSTADHLKYNDYFYDPKTFIWESETNTTLQRHRGLLDAKKVRLFVRKAESEDGITLPFTYLGTGRLTDPEQTQNPQKTLTFKLMLDIPLPDLYQFEFMRKSQ